MATLDSRDMPAPWTPDRDLRNLKALGKLAEEAAELGSALARCIIQGIDEAEPTTGKPNRVWLEDEIADVIANALIVQAHFGLNVDRIGERAATKTQFITRWLAMIPGDDASAARTKGDGERCMACAEPFQAGDEYYLDVSGGALHAACAGPEREGYVKDVGTGDPLGPDDPIPEPLIWAGEDA